MVGGLETVETNRRHSLSLALSSLADAAAADAATPLSTLLERKKQTFGGTGRQLEQEQLWPYSKWMTREVLPAPQKEIRLAVVYAHKAPQRWSVGLRSRNHMAELLGQVL